MITVEQLSLSYANTLILKGISLHIAAGEWVALLGRSGCGKTTLLKTIAGLPTGCTQTGCVLLGTQKTPRIAYMAQQDALLPWLSILDNVQLAHRLHGTRSRKTRDQALALLTEVGLAEHAHKAPYQLSGGQRQRAALARTLMNEAEIVLMDEPFSAVDALTRLELQQLAARMLADKTVLLITHDPLEAERLADRLYVMRDQGISAPLVPAGTRPRLQPDASDPALQKALMEALS